MLGRGLAVAALVAGADQLGKAWILALLADRPPAERVVAVAPFLNLVLTWNRGMSFGLFNSDSALNALIFTALAVAIVAGLVHWLRRVRQGLLAFAIGLVIGGAVGNVVDRLARGAVVDFLDFHWGALRFPWAFNVADAAISVGVGLMVIDSLLGRARAPN
jgi:signal peptidase II